MAFKTVQLGIVVTEETIPQPVVDFAIALCERDQAHLNTCLAVPVFDVPMGHALPLLYAVEDEVNSGRYEKAVALQMYIETASRLAGIIASIRIVQEPLARAIGMMGALARLSDIAILPQPSGALSVTRSLVEAVIFRAGRAVLTVPPNWSKDPDFKRIVIGWDGGARAARAVGDAMPLLDRTDEIEIVCIGQAGGHSAAGADLAKYLARRCHRVSLTELPLEFGDAGRVLREHLGSAQSDLLVMGAFAHPRPLQWILGGVTHTMLRDATVPVLYSY